MDAFNSSTRRRQTPVMFSSSTACVRPRRGDADRPRRAHALPAAGPSPPQVRAGGPSTRSRTKAADMPAVRARLRTRFHSLSLAIVERGFFLLSSASIKRLPPPDLRMTHQCRTNAQITLDNQFSDKTKLFRRSKTGAAYKFPRMQLYSNSQRKSYNLDHDTRSWNLPNSPLYTIATRKTVSESTT